MYHPDDDVAGGDREQNDEDPPHGPDEVLMASPELSGEPAAADIPQVDGDPRIIPEINMDISAEEENNLAQAPAHLVDLVSEDENIPSAPILVVNDDPIAVNGEDNSDDPLSENEPPAKMAKLDQSLGDDSDGQTCSICLDTWTVSGPHRIVSLKCGHLFGHSCIDRWLKQMNKTNRSCPTCKCRATSKDLRFIYAKKIAMADNTEVEDLRTQLENTKTEKNRLEMELQKSILSQQLFFNKITNLEREISQLKKVCNEPAPALPKSWKLALRANIEMMPSKDASCRVLAYNSRSRDLYVSQMSVNSLFPGYAMRKISCVDWKLGKMVHLHPKLIRDASYSASNDLLMTVGLDKTVKLVQGTNEMITTTITADIPLWSCCWEECNSNRLYVGGVGGLVFKYDIRQTRTCITSISPESDMSPVVSLTNISNGVLACHLNSFRAHCNRGSGYESRQMSIDGSLLCVRHNPVTEDILVSCRPSSGYQRSRHTVCKIDLQDNFNFVIKRRFEASNVQSLMARSAIFSIGDDEFVAAHSESEKAVCVWSVASEKRVSFLGASDNVVDILPLKKECGDLSHLVTLSPSKVRIYEAVFGQD